MNAIRQPKSSGSGQLQVRQLSRERTLISMVLATLFQQEIMLSNEEKNEFQLAERAIATILDLWESNRIKIKSLDVHLLKQGNLIIQVNDTPRVTFISPLVPEDQESSKPLRYESA